MYDKPNTTPFPDELIDRDLKNLSGCETKIIAVIIRKTFGFHKAWDFISLSQIKDLTGIYTSNIITIIRQLESKGYIKSAYVCPKCNHKVEYKPPEKRKGKHIYSCPSCHTEESPNKWYALNISGEDMEKYLNETLKIKQNNPEKKGGSSIARLPQQGGGSSIARLPQQGGGSSIARLPPDFIKNASLDNDSNVLQETTTQKGSSIARHTINNTINNVQKTSSSSVFKDPSTKIENKIEKKNEDDEFFLQKRKAEEILKKTLDSLYMQCVFLDEDLILIGKHEEDRIERVAKRARRMIKNVKMIPEYILNGLLNYNSLYKEKKGKYLDIAPGLLEHEKFKAEYETTDFEAGKKELGKIFSMLDEKEKEGGSK